MIRLLVWLSLRRWPARVFTNRLATTAYMIRYYLLGGPDHLRPLAWFRLYVNNIRRSDDDTALHNHPWSWAIAIPMIAGYDEERLTPDGIIKRRVKPFRVNFIRGNTFHRIETNYGEAWTLMLVPGKSTQNWGFLDRKTWRFRANRP